MDVTDQASAKRGDLALMPVLRLLSAEELSRATDWINEKSLAADDACQVCGSPHNVVQPSLVPLPGGVNPFSGVGGWLHPSVVTICYNCGFTRHFNAIVMGLTGQTPPPEPSDG